MVGVTFFDIPPELRIKVYRNLFVVGEVDFASMATNTKGHYTKNYHEPTSTQSSSRPRPNLKIEASSQVLWTCKALSFEGLPILYGENPFRLQLKRSSCQAALGKAIGWRARALIKHLILDLNYSYLTCKSSVAILKPFRNLQTMDIQGCYGGGHYSPATIKSYKPIAWQALIERSQPSAAYPHEFLCTRPSVVLRLQAIQNQLFFNNGADSNDFGDVEYVGCIKLSRQL
ncbi:hypothetical protein EJ08DRAFT_288705 [Tothia fuscella]|uniref:Uncharacterized protein n=1 Tax=Tothia fuscella TaxID=1048955 RepID=A0A9P4P2L7_9PEZI|nr:hypothetical protein EJ08DRAFT_288705 [Tothia fuscella]